MTADTMQSPNSPATSCPFSIEDPKNPNFNHSPSLSSTQSFSATRLWRPAAQRNIRNQWSKLLSHKKEWDSASFRGRSHASSLVNSHLSQRYMPSMNLGVLSEMPDIRRKACAKLVRQQGLYSDQLSSSYKDLVHAVSHMVSASRSMRCYQKGSAGSPLVQFCSHPGHMDDTGDGGGIPVFSFFSIPYFENLAQELVQMFISELSLKRLLVVQLLSLTCEEAAEGQTEVLNWSHELYPGEFDNLGGIELFSEESCEPVPPRIEGLEVSNIAIVRSNPRPQQDVLQVYLTAWLAEVNVYTNRVDQIFEMVREEMQVSLT